MIVNIPYTIVNNDTIEQVVDHLLSIKEPVGFDVETNKDGSIHFIQIYSNVSETSLIFPVDDLDIDKLTSKWSSIEIVGHNLSYDLSACFKQFGNHPIPIADTFLLACSLQEDQKGLKTLCNQYFGSPIVKWEDLFGDYEYSNMSKEKYNYIANDPYYTYYLYNYYVNVGAYQFVLKAHDIDLKAMLRYMYASIRGLIVDSDKFNTYLEQYTHQVDELQDKLNTYAGWEVRTTSTKDLKKLLFEQLQLPLPPVTTEKGDVSVSKEALSYVPDKDGVVSLITQVKESRSILTAMKNL